MNFPKHLNLTLTHNEHKATYETVEQANNKRNNRLVTLDGNTYTLANACRLFNANYNRVKRRLLRNFCDVCAFTVGNNRGCPHRNTVGARDVLSV